MIHFRILGGVELLDAGGAELRTVLTQPKRLALLAYLAASEARQFHGRETLLGLFWPELDEAHARAALSQAVYYLRQAIGAEVMTNRGSEEIGVDPERLWCDAAEFDRALRRGDAVEALELYRGDLLSGLFLSDTPEWEHWLESERSRLRSRAAEAAWTLAEAAEAEGRPVEATRRGYHALELAGDEETQLRKLIALLERVGDRAGAVRAYEEFALRLARDYELEVSPETQELIAEVRSREEPFGRGVTTRTPRPSSTANAQDPTFESPPPEKGIDESPDSGRRRSLVVGRTAAIVAALAIGVSILWPRRDTRTVTAVPTDEIEVSARNRLAVLPLAYFGADSMDEYLADGMTEELISRLSMLSGLRVIARTSVMSFRKGDRSTADIAQELDVGHVLEGSVRRSGDRVRVSVQLIDAKTQLHIWAENYDAALGDILDVQREIAERVAMALPVRRLSGEWRRLAKRGTSDPEAHLLYLRGRYVLGRDDPGSFDRARDYFEQALERDPTYARAWSGLSDALDQLVWTGALPPNEAYPRARAAAERALELDPDLAEAHASLAKTLTSHYWASEEAEHHFRQALQLDPSDARAHRMYAVHLGTHGRLEQARAEAEKALELDPLSFFSHFEMVVVAYFEGRHDEVIRGAERLIHLDPDYPTAHFVLALVHVQKRQYDAALDALGRVEPWRPREALSLRGYIQGRTGRREAVRATLAALDAQDDRSRGSSVAFDKAVVHLGLGETERVLDLLEEAIEDRDWRVRLLKADPMFAALRSEPRFGRLLERAGFGE